MDSCAIRPAGLSDVDTVARVHTTAWLATYCRILPEAALSSLDLAKSTALWRRVLGPSHSPRSKVFVAERGLDVVGFACLLMVPDEAQRTELLALYVHPQAQGRGIGRRLVAAVEEMAATVSNSMVLWVHADNARARLFYEALGGREEGSRILSINGAAVPEVQYRLPSRSGGRLAHLAVKGREG